MKYKLFIIFFLSLLVIRQGQAKEFKVLQMNIWQEGTMVVGGFDAIINEVDRLNPDVVLFSEVRNYNSVDFIQRVVQALRLKHKNYFGKTSLLDVGIISKLPISRQEVIYPLNSDKGSVLKANIKIENKTIAFYSVHLDYTNYACYLSRGYSGITWKKLGEKITDSKEIEKANQESLRDETVKSIIEDVRKDESDFVIVGGDFNEPSYLDWTKETQNFWDHNGAIVKWDCSILLHKAGFKDAYRTLYPNVVTYPGFTFPSDNRDVSPEKLTWIPDADERDRIDFIYFIPNANWNLTDISIVGPSSSIIKGKRHEENSKDPFIKPLDVWPTDHKALIATFNISEGVNQKAFANQALKLDGDDNNVRTGIGIIKPPFTLEVWIKGNDENWKDCEVIVGGGEYSALKSVDFLPLVIKNGKLFNSSTGICSLKKLNGSWHHVALTCDGKQTSLFLDGHMEGKRDTSISILPGAIGVNEDKKTIFEGWIDEVRLWNVCLPKSSIIRWMNKPIEPRHPYFDSLLAYYNFDDGIDDSAPNIVGKGALAFHLRNTRMNYKENTSLAFTEPNDNRFWKQPIDTRLLNAVVVDSEWDVDQGAVEDQILKLRITLTGTSTPLSLEEISLDFSKCSSLKDLLNVHIYHTGKKARSNIRTLLYNIDRMFSEHITANIGNKKIFLTPGVNYILVTADVSKSARIGNRIKFSIPSIRLSGKIYKPEECSGTLPKSIVACSKIDSKILKVLQWNIWHGGAHLGSDGQGEIIKLIKASGADIITMQEAYGAQQRIADSLEYYMRTFSMRDNIAVYSRYPVITRSSYNTFMSYPVEIRLSNGKPILVDACWLRYAQKPEYTWCFPDPGQDTKAWVAEDSTLALVDAKNMLEKDIEPLLNKKNIPVIIGGDFNSCSHLDWTKRASHLHCGYGKIEFPVSIYMYEHGFKDSFREANPNEIERPEGTFAGIYNQIPNNRIDFIYYRGDNLRLISSKIIQTSPEIDDVWASDHSAVISIFETW